MLIFQSSITAAARSGNIISCARNAVPSPPASVGLCTTFVVADSLYKIHIIVTISLTLWPSSCKRKGFQKTRG